MTRSLWKGPFVDNFLSRHLKKEEKLVGGSTTRSDVERSSVSHGLLPISREKALVMGGLKIYSKSTTKGLTQRVKISSINKIWSRRSTILPQFLDCTFEIYNGKQFIKLKVTEDMVGHKFGEFALTRKKPKHPVKSYSKGIVKKKK